MVEIEIVFENTDSIKLTASEDNNGKKFDVPMLITLEEITSRILIDNYHKRTEYNVADVFLSIPKNKVDSQKSWVMPEFTGWDLLVNTSISVITIDGVDYNVYWGDDVHLNSAQKTSVESLSNLEEARVTVSIRKENIDGYI